MKRFFLVTLLFLLSQIHFSFGQITIKMQKKGGVYVVPCVVNGLNLRFVFDTGASDVSISLTEASFMLKNNYLNQEDILGKEFFKDATGNISAGTKIILRKIEFAGLTLTNVEATVVHEMAAPLLLGQTAMAKLGKFQFDPNNGVLIILNGANNSYNTERTTKISNLNIAKQDLPGVFNWYEAIRACSELGHGWRLPTKKELNQIYEDREKIDGLADFGYWSSTEGSYNDAWMQMFGAQGKQGTYGKLDARLNVRAVRDF